MAAEANEEKPLPPKKVGSRRLKKQPVPATATAGAHEAEEALFDQCGEWAVRRDRAAMDKATIYLVNEAETRPTWELLGLLSEAGSDLLGGFCKGSGEGLRLSGQILRAAGKVEDALRGPNRFLDK